MICPFCRKENTDEAIRCARCGLAFSVIDDGETFAGSGTSAKPEQASKAPSTASAMMTPPPGGSSNFGAGFSSPNYGYGPVQLEPGCDFGPRYRIESKLGEGGMGTVYKAFDRDLDRMVALKLLRPEMVANATALQRFKQELLLASKISQKNVLRIHDLGDLNGMKFISMAFVEGEDLRILLNREGQLPFDRIVAIAKQLCGALEAAQAEGVVHRDLKPHNVLVDKAGNVYVSDFGLAKSLEAGAIGMTRTNEFLGTPRYMSPEQVEGGLIDHRTDLYSLGLIIYEMVTGEVPFTGESTLQVMYKRVKEAPKDPRKVRPEMPEYLGRIILKCLEKDPKRRYQSARELLDDLDAARKPTGSRSIRVNFPMVEDRQWKWVAGTVGLALVLVLAIAPVRRFFFGGGGSQPDVTQKPVSVLIADFQNGTGEPVFDGTLEPALNVALEGASFVRTFERGQARKIITQLKTDATVLDEAAARLVAVREGISVIVTGSIVRSGNGYSISVRAVDAATGKELTGAGTDADGKDDVLKAVSKLAARVRTGLGDVTPESLQLAAAETFTSGSIEAAQQFARGQELQHAGKYDEALRQLLKATELDPELGRAYAAIATIHANMGRAREAENYFQLSFSKIDRMSDREKYRTRSAYYLSSRNLDKAIEELNELVRRYPSDSAGLSNLALGYFWKRDMPKTLQFSRRAVELSPRAFLDRSNLGLYAMYAGDFETAMREQRTVMEANASLVQSYLGLALSQLASNHAKEAASTYEKLAALEPSYAAIGQADLALFEGRPKDAIAILQGAIQKDVQQQQADPGSRALKLALLSDAQVQAGAAGAAASSADQAVSASKQDNVLYLAARTFIAAGREARALEIAKELGRRLGADPRAYALLIEGEVELKHNRAQEAVQKFSEAKKLADTWLGRLALGRAHLERGEFAEAYSEFEACLKRRGEATAIFLDEVPTYAVFPPVYYFMGRAQEGLKSPAAAESYQSFLKIREPGQETPMVADAKRRLAKP